MCIMYVVKIIKVKDGAIRKNPVGLKLMSNRGFSSKTQTLTLPYYPKYMHVWNKIWCETNWC